MCPPVLHGTMKPEGSPHHDRGFTFVELLATIVITALLISLIIPVVSQIRYSSRIAQCATNQRQIFTAFELYAGDNNGMWPPTWDNSSGSGYPSYPWLLRDYIPTKSMYGANTAIYTCPEAKIGMKRHTLAQHYGVNRNLYRNGEVTKPTPKNFVAKPSRTIFLGDMCWDNGNPNSSIAHYLLPGTSSGAPEPASRKHANGAANVIFADGHIEFFKNSYELSAARYRDRGPEDLWMADK